MEQNELYDYYFFNWDQNRQNFLGWLEIVLGFAPEVIADIGEIVRTNEDFNRWCEYWDGDFNTVIDTMEKYMMVVT